MIKFLFKLGISLVFLLFSISNYAQTPILSYSFESGQAQDDSGTYPAQLVNNAMIVKTDDGNSVLSTGSSNGYLDLGTTAGQAVLSQLTGDYSISIDICVGTDNNLGSYCWAWAMTNSTTQYLGLINAAGNGDWYYEIKNSSTSNVKSNSGISTAVWHNITIVQSGTTCTYYYDGVAKASGTISLKPSGFASSITGCYIGKSPFAADSYMKNTLVDNFKIYNTALTATQVQSLAAARPTSTALPLSSELKEDIAQFNKGNKCTYLHENLALPTTSSSGATYSYSVTGSGLGTDGTVTLTNSVQNAILKVTLTNGTTSADSTLQVRIAPDDNKVGYLFVHFNSNTVDGQQLRYALSTKDQPLIFKTMLNGAPVVAGDSVASTGCIRDPHILRGNDGYFYMVMTDMNSNLGWWSNHAMVLMKSKNLVDWQHAVVDFKTKYPAWNITNSSAVWAPQTIWDPNYINTNGTKGRYMVYYGLYSSGVNTIHLYYSYANDRFNDLLGDPVEMMKNGDGTEDDIDGDCIWSPNDSLYHMFYTHGGVREKVGTSLTANDWTPLNGGNPFNNGYGEGSTTYRLINSNTYEMLYDNDAGVYYYASSDDGMETFSSFQLMDRSYIAPRHGTVMTITQEEQNLLNNWNQLNNLISGAKAIQAKGGGDANLTTALNKAEQAVNMGWNIGIPTMTTAMSNAMSGLSSWINRYKLSMVINRANSVTQIGTYGSNLQNEINTAKNVYQNSTDSATISNAASQLDADIVSYYKNIISSTGVDKTSLITNADFSTASATGWSGTTPGFGNGAAEFYNKTFNFNQTIGGLTNGYYMINVQAFYRDGSNDAGGGYSTGTENLNAMLYGNSSSKELNSLYSVKYSGTNSLNGYVNGLNGTNIVFSDNSDNYANYLIVPVTNGSLTIGLKKTASVTYDWCAFDNFKLYFLDGISEVPSIQMSTNKAYPIYNLMGVVVGKTAKNGSMPNGLSNGVYIVNGAKCLLHRQ